MNDTKKPIHVIRYGAIHASIWKNQTDAGERFNVTIHRVYKVADEWKRSESFGRNELLAASKALDVAHTWVCDHERKGESQGE